MAPSHHDREEETLIAYFQQMLAEVDDEEFDGELQEQGDMQAAPADESSYSKEANESVLTSANAAIDANHAALASTGASSTIVSAQGEVSSKTIADSDSLTVSATNAAVVTQSVVSKGLNEQSAPLKTEPSNLESAKASTEGIVISSAVDETVSATQAQEQEVATGSSVDRAYDAISKEPFISIDEEEPSTSEFVQIGIQPKAVTSSVTTSSSTAAVQSKTVVTTTPDSTEVIHTHTTDDAIVIEKVVSGTSVEDAEHVADDKEAQSSESSSDSIAQPSVAQSSAQEDAEQSASESSNEIPVDAESAADAAMIAAAEQAEKDKADTVDAESAADSAENAADAAMIAAAEQAEKDKADTVDAESAADAAMIAAAEQSDKDKADTVDAESAADAAMIAAAEQSEKDKADTVAAESVADAAMIAAAEQSEKDKADAVAAESAADAAMIAAAEQSEKDKADAVAAESSADAAMIAAAEQSENDKADAAAAAAESAADAAMIAAAQSSADEESSSAVSYEPQLQTATKTETAKELEFAEPGDSESLQRLLNTIVPQTATETKVAEPEVKVETKVAEPDVKVETKVAEPEVKVETKVAEPEVKVEAKVAKPEVKVEAKVAKPEVKVEQVQKIEQVTKAPPQTAEQRMADKLHAINKDWKNVDLGEQFQVLFFLVQGVRFAVPLIDLGGIFECDKITNLFGKPSWFMGITDVRGDKINIVDTLRWVKPDIKKSPEKYPYLISLGMSPWSIGCDVLEGNRTLTSSQIKWREIPGNRPWLAGIVTAEKCALLHVKALIALFEAGADIEDLVRNISEEKR
ncbi:chemotaxis protein CheW [Anaerobiospirillum succiniciproducens]|uniref:chemotaxis protein CheW n=1 Tax=Anaerobiospirillum succiniciproducens TaxID=13335 RepID=UPI0023575139|nr:chemotaxis protein CheW [Anaerobiospirillum succiniciproducens]MCI6862841.1 chemotaxis protein CheW [Anaerobiospirillum succiniciproducens]